MFKVKIVSSVKEGAEYAVKSHDVQMRRKTSRYGKPKGSFMVNPGYFVSKRDSKTGRFA